MSHIWFHALGSLENEVFELTLKSSLIIYVHDHVNKFMNHFIFIHIYQIRKQSSVFILIE